MALEHGMASSPQNLEALSAAFNGISVALSLYDSSGNLVDINEEAMKLYGIIDKTRLLSSGIKFGDDPNMKKELDLFSTSYTDQVIRYLYNCDKVMKAFPGLTERKGNFLLSLKIHPIYDKTGKLLYLLVTSTDLTKAESEQTFKDRMKDDMSFMMSAEGVSAWMYDVTTGKRILDFGSHLFPKMETMSDFLNIVHREDVVIITNIITLIKYGGKIDGHAKIRVKDPVLLNQYIYLEVFCMPHMDDGKVSSISFITKDVTDREGYLKDLRVKDHLLMRQTQAYDSSNKLLHTLIDRLPCIFFIKDVDDEFRYLMVNEQFCEKIGKTRTEILGHTDYEVLPIKKEVEMYRVNDHDAIAKGTVTIREETFWRGVRKVWQTAKYYIVTNDGRKMILAMSQDITALDNSYHEVLAAKEEAVRSDKLKSAFLANINHEIRTPLNSIMGFSHLLSESDSGEDKIHYSKVITDNGKALTDIIDEILMLSQMEAGYFTSRKETFDLTEFIYMLQDNYSDMVPSNLDFVVSAPSDACIVTQDRMQLIQIMHKLIRNAIKYTSDGKITIGYECSDSGFSIFVEDTGPGLGKEELSKIFKRFEKLDEYSPGVGLGLVICKMLTEHLGGKIDVWSKKGVGSKFSAWFPR